MSQSFGETSADLVLSMEDVDTLGDALGEALSVGTFEHWNGDALRRLTAIEKRLRDHWNAQPREVRDIESARGVASEPQSEKANGSDLRTDAPLAELRDHQTQAHCGRCGQVAGEQHYSGCIFWPQKVEPMFGCERAGSHMMDWEEGRVIDVLSGPPEIENPARRDSSWLRPNSLWVVSFRCERQRQEDGSVKDCGSPSSNPRTAIFWDALISAAPEVGDLVRVYDRENPTDLHINGESVWKRGSA